MTQIVHIPFQCKDIPDEPILRFIESLKNERWGTMYRGAEGGPLFDNSVWHALPEGTPERLARAKIKKLISRGLLNGCVCGCRGDLELTTKGLAQLNGGTQPCRASPGYSEA